MVKFRKGLVRGAENTRVLFTFSQSCFFPHSTSITHHLEEVTILPDKSSPYPKTHRSPQINIISKMMRQNATSNMPDREWVLDFSEDTTPRAKTPTAATPKASIMNAAADLSGSAESGSESGMHDAMGDNVLDRIDGISSEENSRPPRTAHSLAASYIGSRRSRSPSRYRRGSDLAMTGIDYRKLPSSSYTTTRQTSDHAGSMVEAVEALSLTADVTVYMEDDIQYEVPEVKMLTINMQVPFPISLSLHNIPSIETFHRSITRALFCNTSIALLPLHSISQYRTFSISHNPHSFPVKPTIH